MKTGPIIRVVILTALVCLSVASIYYIDRNVLDDQATNTLPSPTKEAVETPLSLGTTVIQTFHGSTLIRSGSGAVVSSDGLIVAPSSVAPYGSGSYVYQVVTSRGSIFRGQAVWRSRGLVILKVPSSDLNAVLFSEDVIPFAGYQAQAVGALLSSSRYMPLVLPVDVAYTSHDDDVALSLDVTYIPVMSGARVIDESGLTIGLVQSGPYARLLPSSLVNDVIEAYLSQKK